jgi:steroid delta-isomerase
MTATAPTEAQMEAAAQQYAVRLTAGDAAGVAALFSPDAVIEDPIGSAPKVGHDTILAFYTGAIERAHPVLTVTGPVRTVPGAATAAMPFRSRSFFDNRHVEIDVFEFTADGHISSMKAYFGPANITATDGN